MPEQLLQLIPTHILREASKRAFNIRTRHFFEMCVGDECLPGADVQSLIALGGNKLMEESASAHAWQWSVRKLGQALRAGGSAIPLDAMDHVELDSTYPERLPELLFWQLLGLLASQALIGKRHFEFSVNYPPPRSLCLPGVGRLTLTEEPNLGRYHVSVHHGRFELAWGVKGISVSLDPAAACVTPSFRFVPALRIGTASCVAFDNDALCRQFFQPFPLLLGRRANLEYAKQLQRCWNALIAEGPPGLEAVLSLCDSLIGLCSLTESTGSGSREEALGLVFLPAGTDDENLAECLLHEALHQYLFRVEASTDLFTEQNSKAENFYSPWRTDGRPLRMVLHGAFVFSGVASLHVQWHRTPGSFQGSLAAASRRVEESVVALDIVKRHALLTPVGQKIVRAIEAELAHSQAYLADVFDDHNARDLAQQRKHEFPQLVA